MVLDLRGCDLWQREFASHLGDSEADDDDGSGVADAAALAEWAEWAHPDDVASGDGPSFYMAALGRTAVLALSSLCALERDASAPVAAALAADKVASAVLVSLAVADGVAETQDSAVADCANAGPDVDGTGAGAAVTGAEGEEGDAGSDSVASAAMDLLGLTLDTPLPVESLQICLACGESGGLGEAGGDRARLKWCSRCKAACFCSRECQRAAWPFHKPHCDVAAPGPAAADEACSAAESCVQASATWLQCGR